ncbi:hypothetical protein [Clostridium sp.]|uniref:hypothetical protein n=1 Tax=Clostridium sp. TaxID=1506 RepID=UPI00290C2435|nr:hypothetical protein [Clostridium sp.]MDU7363895.1 hypothetical protein [Clostridium sp.]
MKIDNIDILITKIEVKENKEGKGYLIVNLLDLFTGDNFQIINKDLELLGKLKPMTKFKMDFDLTSSKYGLRLDISKIVSEEGNIN